MQPRRAFAVVLLAAAGMIGSALPAVAASVPGNGYSHTPPAVTAVSCQFELTMVSWATGFNGSLKVANTGSSTANNWWIEFDLSAGADLTNGWNGTFQQINSHVRVDAPSWQRDLLPGHYANPQFTGEYSSTNGVSLSNIKLNGVTCSDPVVLAQKE
jgi:cellulase/cellobiase CelA1